MRAKLYGGPADGYVVNIEEENASLARWLNLPLGVPPAPVLRYEKVGRGEDEEGEYLRYWHVEGLTLDYQP